MASYSIENQLSHHVIAIGSNSSGGNALLDADHQTGQSNEQWEFVPDNTVPGYYTIQSNVGGKVVDIQGDPATDGAPLVSSTLGATASDGQLWQLLLDPAGSGYYFIQNRSISNVITIAGDPTADGSPLAASVRSLTDNGNQLWKAVGGEFPSPVPTAQAPAIGLTSSSQYIMWGALHDDDAPIAIRDIAVDIVITKDLIMDSTTPPMGIQLNGFSPRGDKVSWQQYAVIMTPDSNCLSLLVNNWLLHQPKKEKGIPWINPESPNVAELPDNYTIPAGWRIQMKLKNESDGKISEFSCLITQETNVLFSPPPIKLLGQPFAWGKGQVGQNDLAELVAFQVVMVGYGNFQHATLLSGAGTIECTSSTPLTPKDYWPHYSDNGHGTGESSNIIYGVVPARTSSKIIQPFGVPRTGHPRLGPRVGDMDGDGEDEILVSSPYGFGILKQSGKTMESLVGIANGTRVGGWIIDSGDNVVQLIADFDQSGRHQILVSSAWGMSILKYSSGELTELVGSPNSVKFGGEQWDWTYAVFGPVGDFDGDGQNEFLVAIDAGVGIFKLVDGVLTLICFAEAETVLPNDRAPGGWQLDPYDSVFGPAADYDGDGRSEILVRSPWGMGILELLPTVGSSTGYTLSAMAMVPNGTSLNGWTLARHDVFGDPGNYSGGIGGEELSTLVSVMVSSPWGVGLLCYDPDTEGGIGALAVVPNGPLPGGWNLQTRDNVLGPTADYEGNGQDQILVSSFWGVGVLTLFQTSTDVNVPPSYTLRATVANPNGPLGEWKLDTAVDALGCVGNYSPTYGQLGFVQTGVFVTSPWGVGILKLSEYDGVSSPMLQRNGTRFGGWLLDTLTNVF